MTAVEDREELPSLTEPAYLQRPYTAFERPSPYLDVSPLPENVDLHIVPSLSSSFESAGTDARKRERIFPREKLRHRALNDARSRPYTAPPAGYNIDLEKLGKESANLRSARYLAIQWRSRATQWSASSSMRSFRESSSLQSGPPPPLKDTDGSSDSDLDSANESFDESVQSQVSDAYKVLEPWKRRADSLSQGGARSYTDETGFKDSRRSVETLKMSANLNRASDEFNLQDSFGFAFAAPSDEQQDQFENNIRGTSYTQNGDSVPPESIAVQISSSQRTMKTGTTKNDGLFTPDHPIPVQNTMNTTSPRSVIPTAVSDGPSASYAASLPEHSEPESYVKAETKTIRSQNLEATGVKQTIQPSSVISDGPSASYAASLPQHSEPESYVKAETKTVRSQNLEATGVKQTIQPSSVMKTMEALKLSRRKDMEMQAQRPIQPTAEEKKARRHAKQPIQLAGEPNKVSGPMQSITWDVFDVVFTFTLLTSEAKAPPAGDYVPDDECASYKCKLQVRSKLLYEIMNTFELTLRRIRTLSNESGKYMMCPPDCTPTMKHVRRDGK